MPEHYISNAHDFPSPGGVLLVTPYYISYYSEYILLLDRRRLIVPLHTL